MGALHASAIEQSRDHHAVLNGLMLPHNSGAVEGNVNRIKLQMYGRAAFDLSVRRVLSLAGQACDDEAPDGFGSGAGLFGGVGVDAGQ
jgi:hypothetical protein